MALEIERKFLVNKQLFIPSTNGERVRQLYLKRDPVHSVRVRIMGSRAFVTIKKTVTEMIRNEFEYKIPLVDAKEMFGLFKDMPAIEKIRYQETINGNTWVIDEFLGKNKGLLMAEIELPSSTTKFKKPVWLDREVTKDGHYHNSNLAVNPLQGK